VGNIHVNFNIIVYSPTNITSLFYPISKFSYFCICDTPLNCYYFTHQSHPFAHLTSFRRIQNSLSKTWLIRNSYFSYRHCIATVHSGTDWVRLNFRTIESIKRGGKAGTRRELLDFMVQGKINRGRHTDHPARCHSTRTNQCPPPPSRHFLQAGCPSCCPTNSVKALKATKPDTTKACIHQSKEMYYNTKN